MAPSFVEAQDTNSGPTSPTFTNGFSGNGGAGSDAIFAFTFGGNGTNALGFSDNFNSGNYTTLLGANGFGGTGYGTLQIGYMICNAGANFGAGALTVSSVGGGGVNRVHAEHWHGFVNTAQFGAGDISTAFSASNSSAVNSGSFNTSQPNEYILGLGICNSNFSNPPSGIWGTTFVISMSQLCIALLTASPVAQGTNVSFNVTASGSTNPWIAAVLGFYDGVSTGPMGIAGTTTMASDEYF
jgi:hypothetical protein